MKIVVAVRCLNESANIERFLHGYDFCDSIIVSDGGSTDDSVSKLQDNPKVILHHFDQKEIVDGVEFNWDAPHMNFVLDRAKELEPDWIVFDDLDCVPNKALRDDARDAFSSLEDSPIAQINVFRLYLWGDRDYFPLMNRNFDEQYRSLWAWRPEKLYIRADPEVHHGTLFGLAPDPYILKAKLPYCLLHKSWHPDTIEKKLARYKAMGIETQHPLEFAGTPEPLPDWAVE